MIVSQLVTMLTSYKDKRVLPCPNQITFSAVLHSRFNSMGLRNYDFCIYVADI